METILKGLGLGVLVFAMIFIASLLGGTVLWLIYPHIHKLFLTAASSGIIPYELEWWDSVCITWIFSILIKGGSSSSSNSKD